ncbi:histone-like nucleoid-structuring protein Lsr2 [Streptomyces sp. NPDC059070]|uniref:Lsr2 family DNA-binding protein n=1 Tax=Streptomyces sp. NPDC059070 TaxID=3346713 RepID=UPI0036B43373
MSRADVVRTVVAMLQASDGPVRQSVLVRSLGVSGRDLLDLEGQGVIVAELVGTDGPGRPVAYRLPLVPLDPDAVRAYTVSKGLCDADSPMPVSPPEFRAYESHLQQQERAAQAAKAREAKEAATTRQRKRRDLIAGWPGRKVSRVRAWAAQERLEVGTRGRLPKWVIDKYDAEADDEAELQALIDRLGDASVD